MELRPQDLDAAHREIVLSLRQNSATPEDGDRRDRKGRRKRRGFRFFPFMFLGFFAFNDDLTSKLQAPHWVWLLFFLLPLAFLRGRNTVAKTIEANAPITLAEASALGASAEPLEASYALLLRSVLETQGLSASAQKNVHEALRDIGDLAAKLAANSAPSITLDPEELQRQADETEEKARTESDPVIAASLRRQAETIRSSAVLGGQRATLRRRREAAREEVRTQIQAMQVSLESHALSGQNESGDFAGLTTNIQQIAAEVNATLNAREEVRAVIEPQYQEPPTQKLGR